MRLQPLFPSYNCPLCSKPIKNPLAAVIVDYRKPTEARYHPWCATKRLNA